MGTDFVVGRFIRWFYEVLVSWLNLLLQLFSFRNNKLLPVQNLDKYMEPPFPCPASLFFSAKLEESLNL